MNYMHVLVHACMHTNIHLFMNNNLSSLNNLDYKKVSLLQLMKIFSLLDCRACCWEHREACFAYNQGGGSFECKRCC